MSQVSLEQCFSMNAPTDPEPWRIRRHLNYTQEYTLLRLSFNGVCLSRFWERRRPRRQLMSADEDVGVPSFQRTDRHDQNCFRNRTSFSTRYRMSVMPYFRMAM